MRRRYVGVIVDALGILQHGCHGHLYMTWVIGRRTSLLDQGRLVDLAHGFESLHRRLTCRCIGGHGGCPLSSFLGKHDSGSGGLGSSDVY